MPPKPYILAVDIGSSAVKAGLYDAEANALPHTLVAISHQQRTAADGTHEEDGELIQRVTELAIDRVLDLAEEEVEHIAAVGFDAMASTILGVDARHEPVTPVFTYADTRTGCRCRRVAGEHRCRCRVPTNRRDAAHILRARSR